MSTPAEELLEKARTAREGAKALARIPTWVKDEALRQIAKGLIVHQDSILAANEIDYTRGKREGLKEALLDRLLLTPERLRAQAEDVRRIADLPDPVGEIFDMRTLTSGLQVGKRRVPLGVIGAIYESRPNVTIDISCLCLKSGNGALLRGGKEALSSNTALMKVVRQAVKEADGPADAFQLVESTDRALVKQMLGMREYIDLLVPRGGADLIRFVAKRAAVPVVAGGIGVCHIYVDKAANIDNAVAVAYNAKVQRPSVCNALDTLLVHEAVASSYLPRIAREWSRAEVEMRCDQRSLAIIKDSQNGKAVPAKDDDWGREFLDLIASVKVVDSFEEALLHIERYGSGHSEAILTEDYTLANRFLEEVDAAAVLVNASTRLVDGGQFGLGAEVGISTQKMHARGPLGLRELTSYKWIVLGKGHIRP